MTGWVAMGYINIPKRFLKNHKTSNAFDMCSTSLHDSLLKLCQQNQKCGWRIIQEDGNNSRMKRPAEDIAKNQHALHWEYVFQMAVQEENFRSNQLHHWDSSSSRPSFYRLSAVAPHPFLVASRLLQCFIDHLTTLQNFPSDGFRAIWKSGKAFI